MTVRPIKTARSLQILHEIEQIPPAYRERTSASVYRARMFLIGLTLTCDVHVRIDRTCKDGRADRGLRCKDNESVQTEYEKKKKHKM